MDFVRKLLKKRRVRRMRKLIDMPDYRLGKAVRSYFGRADKVLRFVRKRDDDYFIGIGVGLFMILLFLALILGCLIAAFFSILLGLITIMVCLLVYFFFIKNEPKGTWEWYNGLARYRGRIGTVIRSLYRNDNSHFHKSEYGYYSHPNILDDWNRIPFITIPYSLSDPKYWSDSDYGRIMKLVTVYALVYEETDGHPSHEALDSLVYDEDVHNDVQDVVGNVNARARTAKDRAKRIRSAEVDYEVEAVKSLKESVIGIRIDPNNPDMARILSLMNSIHDKHEELDIVLRKGEGK